jgi:hypothetical protein
MEPGEKQLREIFEKTTITNIRAIISYNQLTEDLVKKLEKKIKDLDHTIRLYDEKFEAFQKQLAVLLTRIYSGGS